MLVSRKSNFAHCDQYLKRKAEGTVVTEFRYVYSKTFLVLLDINRSHFHNILYLSFFLKFQCL